MVDSDKKRIFSSIAVWLSCTFSVVWSHWGIIENFHEGWYYDDLCMNLFLMFRQYYAFALLFILLPVLAVLYKRIGGWALILVGICVPLFWVRSSAAIVIFSIPMILIGTLFLIGTSTRTKTRLIALTIPPLLVTICFGFEPALRVANRIDDGNKMAREIKGNNVSLIWAPAGPGWPQTSADLNYSSWNSVKEICAHLSEDGTKLEDTLVGIWRLPSISEVVASLTRNGTNAGGHWDSISKEANYVIKPDKESPLWNVHSPIIYWWTSTEVDSNKVYRIVYNGSYQAVSEKLKMGSLGFRAVKDPVTKN